MSYSFKMGDSNRKNNLSASLSAASASSCTVSEGPKRRKFGDTVVVSQTSTSNSFDVLTDFENMDAEEIANNLSQTKTKIPPVIIYHNMNLESINNLKKNLTGDIKIKYRGNRNNIYAENMDDYNKIMNFASESKIEHYTHTPKGQKEIKMILKNISPNISAEEISEDLENQNLKINRISQMIKKMNDFTQVKLPIFVINFAANTNKSDVFRVKYVCNNVIEWDNYRSNIKIMQCFRCQGFNHISKNCFKNPKCRLCSGSHFTSQCTDSSDRLIKCANCGGEHESNSVQCEVYNRVLQLQKDRRSPPRQAEPITDPAPELDSTNFPNTLRQSEPPNINNNNIQINKPSTTQTHVTGDSDVSADQPTFGQFFKEIKDIFGCFNMKKVKKVISNTFVKIKASKDTFDKLSAIAEGLFEMFSDD